MQALPGRSLRLVAVAALMAACGGRAEGARGGPAAEGGSDAAASGSPKDASAVDSSEDASVQNESGSTVDGSNEASMESESGPSDATEAVEAGNPDAAAGGSGDGTGVSPEDAMADGYGDASVSADSGLDAQGAPDAGTAPSCSGNGPGVSECGADKQSCCTSLLVPGGTFYRTYVNVGTPTQQANPATLSGFRLDKYLITIGRFRRFVEAWKAGWLPAAGSGRHVHLNGGKGLVNTSSPGSYEAGWSQSDDGYISPTDQNLGCMMRDAPYAAWTSAPGSRESLPINCLTRNP